MDFEKFVDAFPSNQNAVDIFKGHWACSLPQNLGELHAGNAPLFLDDPRPDFALSAFGGEAKSFKGVRILELGPLEAAHTYKLEGYGANVTAIEGNAEAFLKCLIIKDLFDLKAKFQLGNFIKFLEADHEKFDIVFASGVLYHMMEPLKLIKLICETADKSFLWSHYYHAEFCDGYKQEVKSFDGYEAPHYRKSYGEKAGAQFWGGLDSASCWLSKSDIIAAFQHFGHHHVEVIADLENGQNGPNMSLVTRR